MEKRYSRTEQLQHIDAWLRSGLSKPQYCRQHHIANLPGVKTQAEQAQGKKKDAQYNGGTQS